MKKILFVLISLLSIQALEAKILFRQKSLHKRGISSESYDYDANRCAATDKVENSCYFREQKLFPMKDELTEKLRSEVDQWVSSSFDTLSPDGKKFVSFLDRLTTGLSEETKRESYYNMIDQYIEKYAFCKDNAKFHLMNLVLTEDYYQANTDSFAVATTEYRKMFTLKDPARPTDEEIERLEQFKKNKDEARNRLSERVTEKYLKPEDVKNELMICSEIYDNKNFSKVEKVIFPECVTNLETLFGNNSWKMRTVENKDEKFDKCLLNMNKMGAKMNKVIIESSSNLLNNTGETAEKFCRKGFKDLSLARAQEAQEKFAKTLFKNQDVQVEMKYVGQNGDGTSGPCPYDVVDGKELLKERYLSATGKNELLKHNFVKVRVLFEENSLDMTKEKVSRYWGSKCKKLVVKCAQ
jgi:hypothetical protein